MLHSLFRLLTSVFVALVGSVSIYKIARDIQYLHGHEKLFEPYTSLRGNALWPEGAKEAVMSHIFRYLVILLLSILVLIYLNRKALVSRWSKRNLLKTDGDTQ